MNYIKQNNKLIIYSKEEFNLTHILECGQVFSYKKNDSSYEVYSKDKRAIANENDKYIEIISNDIEYFENYFDLNTNYSVIKKQLIKSHNYLKEAIIFGSGIRILKQDPFETIISFIISANNNIKRIQKILFAIRERFGKNKGDYFAFPTIKQLQKASEQDFKNLGAGYRAKYLVNACKYLSESLINKMKLLNTHDLNIELLKIMGVGQKVADCIMLFAFGKQDVFPVDTWIEKVYNTYYEEEHNRKNIRLSLLQKFGNYSGYAQQYFFYSQRSNIIK